MSNVLIRIFVELMDIAPQKLFKFWLNLGDNWKLEKFEEVCRRYECMKFPSVLYFYYLLFDSSISTTEV